jgi:hypothetical protein
MRLQIRYSPFYMKIDVNGRKCNILRIVIFAKFFSAKFYELNFFVWKAF